MDEYSRLPKEKFMPDAPEFATLPDEFNEGATKEASPERKRKKRFRFAAGALIAAVLFTAFVPWEKPVKPEDTVEETTAAIENEAETVPETIGETEAEIQTESETEAPTEPEFEPETLAEYENPGGKFVVSVYGDYFDFEVFANPVVYEETFDEATFTELTLPEFGEYEGASVIGYAVEYSENSADYSGIGYNPDTAPFAFDVGMTLTLDEVQLVPVWEEDGMRHVIVHPVLVTNEGYDGWPTAPKVTLSDGEKSVEYRIDLPLASSGTLYVCSMVPERDGYTFAGYYNEDDEIVYFVHAGDQFKDYKPGTTEIDWFKPTDVTLTAKWVKKP
ncbi:MAG: hypothetical protein Q4B67_01145 [Eubacteriales bacterium]|nr:hypothetical protein [Eubacteriales bacterium]